MKYWHPCNWLNSFCRINLLTKIKYYYPTVVKQTEDINVFNFSLEFWFKSHHSSSAVNGIILFERFLFWNGYMGFPNSRDVFSLPHNPCCFRCGVEVSNIWTADSMLHTVRICLIPNLVFIKIFSNFKIFCKIGSWHAFIVGVQH